MFAQEPNAIRLAKHVAIGLIFLSVALSFFLRKEWMPHFRGVPIHPEILLLFAVPMAALLLVYEITLSIFIFLAKRREAKVRDAEFLRRFTRASRSDRQHTDS